MYLALKHLHVTCVVLSGCGFFLRGTWMLLGSPMLAHRWVRVLPHFVDTILLVSAITMAVLSSQYPFALDWLTAKLAGLLIYIVCGAMALKYASSKAQRAAYFAIALTAFGYIVSVALTRNSLGLLSLIA